MSTFTKTLAITFTVLALGATAQAQSNGGGRGGGGSAGGDGEAVVMVASPNGPITHVERPSRRPERQVRVIAIQPCADGNAALNRHVCNPMGK
ncbi:MAG: hypothetical protein ACRDBL_07110 [Rhabdaerophilum sp.]